jgi:hypothetical protein
LKGENMQIKEVIRKLKEYNQDNELVVFAEGKLYPILDISLFENEVEIDCGWENIKEHE